jgi:hypothetical protein
MTDDEKIKAASIDKCGEIYTRNVGRFHQFGTCVFYSSCLRQVCVNGEVFLGLNPKRSAVSVFLNGNPFAGERGSHGRVSAALIEIDRLVIPIHI